MLSGFKVSSESRGCEGVGGPALVAMLIQRGGRLKALHAWPNGQGIGMPQREALQVMRLLNVMLQQLLA